MQNSLSVDIVIIGAGIAGLWLLNRLRQSGYSVLLLEDKAIGHGQTIASQGIIHGGTKYALTGSISQTGHAIADMPRLWRACLTGSGELDLTGVKILSEHQYLWSTESLSSRIAAFFGSKTLRGRVHPLPRASYPSAFDHQRFKGQVYQLQELVLDVPSLLASLTARSTASLVHTRYTKLQFDPVTATTDCQIELADGTPLTVQAQRYILTAGAGNEALLGDVNERPLMQRRPLQMAIVKHHYAIPLYAHCMIANPKPRVTITTHRANTGETVWYLGGLLAEQGAQQSEAAFIQTTRSELQALFPWLDFTSATISAYRIDRAEPAQADGHLPGGTYAKAFRDRIIAWPTKLAMAPMLCADIEQLLIKQHIQPRVRVDDSVLQGLPKPIIASPIWDR